MDIPLIILHIYVNIMMFEEHFHPCQEKCSHSSFALHLKRNASISVSDTLIKILPGCDFRALTAADSVASRVQGGTLTWGEK